MKQSNLLKILFVVIAVVGLAIGMSAVTGFNNSSDNVNTTVSSDNNSIMDSKCGSGETNAAVVGDTDEAEADVKDAKCGAGKCGGDNVNADAKEAKCGEGKTDEGKCGSGEAKTDVKDAKCGEGKTDESKCGGDTANDTVNVKANDAKCGVGKCG